MHRHTSSSRVLAAALPGLFALSCGGPTSPSSAPASSPATSGEALALVDTPSHEIVEEFNCRELEEVHLRFAHPGWIEGLSVGLYARYSGVPAGAKRLRLWWDYENDPATFRDVALGQGEERRDDPSRFDIERLVEHQYPPVLGRERRLVRAELILDGKTGNCARNRAIVIESPAPPVTASSSSDVEPCDGFRFCELGDGTVRDTTTGLVWLRDADCRFVRRWRRATELVAELESGSCGLTDGSSPGDWRLPTPTEIGSLLDPRFTDPMLSNAKGDAQWVPGDAFENVANGFYWTSELVGECALGLPGASIVHLGNGEERCRLLSIGLARFWPVRAP